MVLRWQRRGRVGRRRGKIIKGGLERAPFEYPPPIAPAKPAGESGVMHPGRKIRAFLFSALRLSGMLHAIEVMSISRESSYAFGVIVLAVCLGSPATLFAEPCSWRLWTRENENQKVIISSLLRSPDGGALAWSVITRDDEPEMVRSKLYLRLLATGEEKILAETRIVDGMVVLWGTNQLLPGGWNFHVLCSIDWSSDGRKILVVETFGPMNSDAGGSRHLLFDRASQNGELVPFRTLADAVVKHWRTSYPDVRPEDLHFAALGWQKGATQRLVVEVSTERPLGFWTMRSDGTQPRLLTKSAAVPAIKMVSPRLGGEPWKALVESLRSYVSILSGE